MVVKDVPCGLSNVLIVSLTDVNKGLIESDWIAVMKA